jgi:phage baseplate assembly protein W
MTLNTRITLPARPNVTPASPQMYRGFSTINSNSKNFALYDFELIKQDLFNSFYIRQGERLMNPEYGCIVWDLLYEPLTSDVKDLLIQNINQIINADPRVQAGNVTVSQYDTGLQIDCKLTYLAYNLSENLRIQFDQNNGLLTTARTV